MVSGGVREVKNNVLTPGSDKLSLPGFLLNFKQKTFICVPE